MTLRLKIPSPLKRGDIVGIAAVSGPVNATNLEKGVQFLENQGFRIMLGRNIHQQINYLAGTDQDRVKSLNELISDPKIRGILFARGGYGSMRILPDIDYNTITNYPKLMMGMSDITALSMAIFSRCCLVTLAGPMLAGQISSGLDEVTMSSLLEALTQPIEHYQILRPSVTSNLRILRTGQTTGYLLGGCLSLLVCLLGTPFCPNFSDCVLFIEDVNEPAYKIDRMLTQMRLAEVFNKLGGVIICKFSGDDSETVTEIVERIVLDYVGSRNIPVISNYPHGHTLPNISLPVGALVNFEVSKKKAVLCITRATK